MPSFVQVKDDWLKHWLGVLQIVSVLAEWGREGKKGSRRKVERRHWAGIDSENWWNPVIFGRWGKATKDVGAS